MDGGTHWTGAEETAGLPLVWGLGVGPVSLKKADQGLNCRARKEQNNKIKCVRKFSKWM